MEKKFNLNDHLLMNLQYFADPASSTEPGSGAQASTEPVDSGAAASGQQTPPAEPVKPADPNKVAKYSEEDVNKLIDSKFAKWKQQQEAAQTQAKKYEEMNDAEKAEFQLNKAQSERDALQAELDKSKMLSTTRQLFAEAKLPADEAIIQMITTTKADSTKANLEVVKSFAKSIKEATEKQFLLGDKQHVSGNQLENKGSFGAELAKNETPAVKDNPFFKTKI